MTYTKDTLRQIFQQPFNMSEWQQMLRHYFHAKELKAEPESINGTSDDEKGYYLGTLDTTDNYRIGLFYFRYSMAMWLVSVLVYVTSSSHSSILIGVSLMLPS